MSKGKELRKIEEWRQVRGKSSVNRSRKMSMHTERHTGDQPDMNEWLMI